MKNFTFNIHENNYNVRIVSHDQNTIELEVNGTLYAVKMKEEIKKSKTPTLVRSKAKTPIQPLKANPRSTKTKIEAPIPGVILSIDVKVGDTINTGDILLVLEAMKMENVIYAHKSGVITAVNVSVGQQVLQSELMIELE